MLYGIEDINEIISSAPTAGAKAVNFDGATSLAMIGGISAADSGVFSMAGWFNTDWTDYVGNNDFAWVIDPENNYTSYMWSEGHPDGDFGNLATTTNLGWTVNSGFSSSWQNWVLTCKTNLSAGSKIVKAYVNRVQCATVYTDASASFNIGYGGLPIWIGNDNSGRWFHGDMSDISFWPGVSFLTGSDIDSTTLDLFVTSDLKWVDPSVAIASLGTPSIMLSGDHTTFASNSLGSDGGFTVNNGALTDASTAPPT